MRRAGRLAARAMAAAAAVIEPGVTTDEIDRVGHEFLLDHGAYPSTLGYPGNGGRSPFPKSLCTSVNEVICHGIPDSTVLREGDIVNIDITAYLVVDGIGVHGDTDATYLVGEVDEESRLLIERTREAMTRGIRAIAPGRQINVIGKVISSYAKRFGYGVVRDFTGHGIGTAFHSGLVIPHYDAAPGVRHPDRGGDDLHGRADAHPGQPGVGVLGRRLDHRHPRQTPLRAVRAHPPGHRHRSGDPHPRLTRSSGSGYGAGAVVHPVGFRGGLGGVRGGRCSRRVVPTRG